MSKVKAKDTKPEMVVRRLLHAMGYRFRLHRPDLPGKPDIVLPKHHKIIQVHGCFWHQHPGCKRARRPTTRTEFWDNKLDGNIARDAITKKALEDLGWCVFVVWECETKDPEILERKLKDFLTDNGG